MKSKAFVPRNAAISINFGRSILPLGLITSLMLVIELPSFIYIIYGIKNILGINI